MKKNTALLFFALFALCVANVNYAAGSETKLGSASTDATDGQKLASNFSFKESIYYSKQHPKPQLKGAVKAEYPTPPATDIVVVNNTNSIIFAVVPFSPVNDIIYPGGVDHIYNDTLYSDTHLVLQDPYRTDFFDRYVCRLAVMYVTGGPGSYTTNVKC